MIEGSLNHRPVDPPTLSVVFPVRNAAGTVRRALGAISAHLDLRPARTWELLVVDDASDDATAETVLAVAREDPRLLLLRNPSRLGAGDAARQGILLARGERILLVNGVASEHLGVLSRMEDHLDEGHDLAVASRRIDWTRPLPPVLIRRELVGRLAGRLRPRLRKRPVRQEGCLLHLYRRSAAMEIYRRQRMNGAAFALEALYLARRYRYAGLEVGIAGTTESGAAAPRLPRDWDGTPADMVRIRIHRLRGDYG